MNDKVKGFWVELILAFRAYDKGFYSGYKTIATWVTLILMAVIVYFLPDQKLAQYVELAGMVHLFVISLAKSVKV